MVKRLRFVFGLVLTLHFLPLCAQEIDREQLENALLQRQDTAQVNALNKLCWEYRREDPDRAIEYGLMAVDVSRRLDYANGSATAFKNLGVCYWLKADYTKAGFYYDKALPLFEAADNKTETGNLQNLYGLLNWSRGEYADAVVIYRAALKTFNETGDREGAAAVLGNIGIIYYETGRYNDALENYLRALQLYLLLNDQDAISNVYNNIGLIYSQQANYPLALKYYKLSLDIDIKNKNLSGQANSFTNIGVCFHNMREPDSSETYHTEALRAYQLLGDRKGISHSRINLGELGFLKKEYEQAEKYFSAALEDKVAIQDQLGEVIVKIHLGRLKIAQGLNVEATLFLTQALALAEQIGSIRYIAEAHQQLAMIYENEQPRLALDHYKEYNRYNDSLVSEETSSKLFNLELGLETMEKEQEIQLLEKESEISAAEKRTMVVGLILFFVLALTILFYQRLRQIRERRLAEKEMENAEIRGHALQLELQNKELELDYNRSMLDNYTQKIVEKNNLLDELRTQLESIQPADAAVDRDRIEKINRLIAARIITDDDWEEFKQLYTKVYPSFFILIKEQFPQITQSELRLSALIKLKLTNREIAAMVGISSDSVKKSRQRLRKKMGMTKEEEDLDQVILSLGD